VINYYRKSAFTIDNAEHCFQFKFIRSNGILSVPRYPTPLTPQPTSPTDLALTAPTQLALYDFSGREVKTLFEGYKNAGYHTAALTSGDLSSGLYFVRLDAGAFSQSMKLVLVK